MTVQEDKLLQALESLGETSDQVAKNLLEKECFGKYRDSESCPLAVYLTNLHGHPVSVECTYVSFVGDDGNECTITLPSPVYHFRQSFDQGDFPELFLE